MASGTRWYARKGSALKSLVHDQRIQMTPAVQFAPVDVNDQPSPAFERAVAKVRPGGCRTASISERVTAWCDR